MNHHLESLGWTLVHFCWQAGVIALIYSLLDAAWANARSQTRYVLALAALLSMLAAGVTTLGYEEMRTASSPQLILAGDTFDLSSISTRGAPLAILSVGQDATPQPAGFHFAALLPWLDVAWLFGVVCLSIRTIGGWWLIQRLRRKALIEAPQALRASFVRICSELGITRHVDLCLSHRIPGPLAMGVVRALILLPVSALTALSPEQLEVVLAHELAHIQRADYLWNLIQTMVETLFFFHPAVWWVSGGLRQQRELCCDDVAMASRPDALVYATALLRLEEQRNRQLNLAMALDGHQSWSGLRARIARILGEAAPDRSPRELAPLPLAAVCAALTLILLPLPQVFAGLHADKQAATPTPPAPVAPAPSAPAPPSPVVALPTPVRPAAPVVAHPAKPPVPSRPKVAPIAPVAVTPVELIIAEISQANAAAADAEAAESAEAATETATDAAAPAPRTDYIDAMRAAGYDVNLDKYIAMKVQGITPEYARKMANAGFPKPSADDLIAMKIQGVTPEYLSGLHAAGIEPSSLHDVIAYRIFHVTPEFISGMQAAGFKGIPPQKLIALRVQGVTPEYARTVKQQFSDVTLDQLEQLRVFHIDQAFIDSAKRHGFGPLTIEKLTRLRISGLLSDAHDEAEAK